MPKTKSISEAALDILNSIPADFRDDGCSNSPDRIGCRTLKWACRIHDWRYCTRCHPESTMCPEHRKMADKELRRHIAKALPWYSQWVRWVYYRAVRRFGTFHAYNSCGSSVGDLCRHNMPRPSWMIVNDTLARWNATLEDV